MGFWINVLQIILFNYLHYFNLCNLINPKKYPNIRFRPVILYILMIHYFIVTVKKLI